MTKLMTVNNVLKIALSIIAVSALSLGANAQFKGLGNKLKQKATQTATNKVDEAERKAVHKAEAAATNKVNLEVEYKTQRNAPTLGTGYDIDDLYDAVNYWLDLQEMANKKKDIVWLAGEKGRQATNYYNELINDNSRNNARFNSFEETKKRFETIADASNALLYEGYPDRTGVSDQEYMPMCLKWYVEKAKKNKGDAKEYYIVNGCAVRYLSFFSGRYTDSPEIQKQTKELIKLWDKLDASVREKNVNNDPHKSFQEIKDSRAEYDRKQAEEKARKEAERKAAIEASKQTLTPGALNKKLNAQVLALARNVEPGVIKVVIENNSWNVQRNALGAILRRTIMAWVVVKDADGNLIAKDYSFAQDYMGGGKYGKLKNRGVGVRSVYVK